ncbi:sulfotransferase domain-containing protein [Psychromonas antarctica]|uniref:sulfotransferase domain-containing protein n=1 Tax=Psychromonas antarctica TaxID=67573 RepID=UPI001EE78FD1|nr:sulfotransferase domain-containing protein [Psychromonas antarctica]
MKTEKKQLIYLAAASHSGSTMTAMLLGAHPDLCSVGELKAVHLGDKDSYLCSCKTLVGECSFWQGVSEKMAKRGQDFCISDARTDIRTGATPYIRRLLKPLVRSPLMELIRDSLLTLSPTWRKQLPQLQKRNADYISAIAEQAGADAVVDSSKIGIRLKYLLKNKDLDIKVIWVVRDGRGVSLAYKNPSEYADAKDPTLRGGGAGKTQEHGRGVETGAHEWIRCNQETQAVLATMDKNKWIKVHYEDICNHTEKTLDEIFKFIGVDPNKKRLDFKAVEHHVVGNGMRLDDSDVIKLDDRWKIELSETDLKCFYNIAGEYHKKLGYDA